MKSDITAFGHAELSHPGLDVRRLGVAGHDVACMWDQVVGWQQGAALDGCEMPGR